MKKILTILCMCCALAACGIGNTNTTYSRSNIGQAGFIEKGTIVSMQPVSVEGTAAVGTIGGAVAGGAAGSMLGGNTAVNIIGGVGGALVGGAIGGLAEKAITKDTAYQFIVKKSNGQTIAVVQSNELNFRVGDKVLLVTTNGQIRLQYDY